MKNIHILPTEKPSRLVKQKYDTIDRLCLADMATKRVEYKRFNLYITSDEEIKEGDWIYDASEMSVIKCPQMIKPSYFTQFCKKIILTTDQYLIKDGVQEIDDKFLEWFFKNPRCEKVEVVKDYSYGNLEHFDYKIIIPKEEPKQETLEEAAEKLYPTDCSNWSIKVPLDERKAFIEGAKWQMERSYSEEEVKEILTKCTWILTESKLKWFEQFKKK